MHFREEASMIDWNYKNENQIFSICERRRALPFLQSPGSDRLVKNGFSTRLGGASKGKFATMNFSYSRGDEPQDVLENFTRMAQVPWRSTVTGWWSPTRHIL